MNEQVSIMINEVEKAVSGKSDIVQKVFTAILAGGHILFDDAPGTGKTNLALAVSRTLDLTFGRIQFTPDILPSDIVGFSIYDRPSGNFIYRPGIVNNVNILLCDEINRTSSRTQSALLETMEEKHVTVDGVTHDLLDPFIVIATQNNVGGAGTQPLPHAQLDRFIIRLSIGYPDFESQLKIIRDRQESDPLTAIEPVMSKQALLNMQNQVRHITISESMLRYITQFVQSTRQCRTLDLGISPRGAIDLSHMVKANAYVKGMNYVTPDDVADIMIDVCAHRVLLSREARSSGLSADSILCKLLSDIPVPDEVRIVE